jgi:hypothetical protein
MLTLFEKAVIMHLIGDWLLQNDWMADNKSNLRHPAAWIHMAIHVILVGAVLGWLGGLVLGIVHILIDTRIPLRWWMRTLRMTQEGPISTHVMIWSDQVIHVICLAAWIHYVHPHI